MVYMDFNNKYWISLVDSVNHCSSHYAAQYMCSCVALTIALNFSHCTQRC